MNDVSSGPAVDWRNKGELLPDSDAVPLCILLTRGERGETDLVQFEIDMGDTPPPPTPTDTFCFKRSMKRAEGDGGIRSNSAV